MKALVMVRPGNSDVLQVQEVPDPIVGIKDVLVQVEACGVNFADIQVRRGERPWPTPIIGLEGAGLVVEVGPHVTDISVGDRVAWPMVPASHAQFVAVPSDLAVQVPVGVNADTAAAIIAQGLTAHYLTSDSFPVRAGCSVLIHAAAGGVGRLLVQLARHRDARVFATTSNEAKFDAVSAAGAHAVLSYDRLQERVLELTHGQGVDAVYDGVGASTFEQSLQAVARRGTLVLYGMASGPIPAFDLARLSRLGSPFITVPRLMDHIVPRSALVARANAVFALVQQKVIAAAVAERLPFAAAGYAHEQLEKRLLVGKIVLHPPEI